MPTTAAPRTGGASEGGQKKVNRERISSLEEVHLGFPCPQCASTNTKIKTGLTVIGPAPKTIGGVTVKATCWPYTICNDCDYNSRNQHG